MQRGLVCVLVAWQVVQVGRISLAGEVRRGPAAEAAVARAPGRCLTDPKRLLEGCSAERRCGGSLGQHLQAWQPLYYTLMAV